MSSTQDYIDIQSLAVIQDSISEISDISFSTYDSHGTLILPSKKEDGLILQIRSYTAGREDHEKSIRDSIEQAVQRKEATIIKGVADQYHMFIPVHVNGSKFMIVSNSFYLSKNDFESFMVKKGQRLGFLPANHKEWLRTIMVKDYHAAQKTASTMQSLFEVFFRSSYERNLNRKKYQWTKTLIDVLVNLQLPVPVKEIYSLALEALPFLYNVDTVSVMVKDKNAFKSIVASGSLREEAIHLYMEENHPLISRCFETFTVVSTNDLIEISQLGFPDSITSIHLFPLSDNMQNVGLIVIFNSVISREESYSILEFCKLLRLVLKNIALHNAHKKYTNDITMLNMTVTKLTPNLYHPDSLYQSIVDGATELVKAEKGSLMMPEDDALLIKAVKGINKWLTQDIRVKIGEGVSGKVFENGKPFLTKNVEKLQLPHIKPKNRYKTGSFVSTPLRFDAETLGVLNVSDKTTGDEFTEDDVALLSQFASYASIALKVSDYYNLSEQLRELSITDPLTGLFNRRYLQERLTEEIHRSERFAMVFSLILFDIDNFKLFNDTEGHLAGDSVLKDISNIAGGCLRANDILSRFGGEEFVVLMPQTSKEEAFVVSERIRNNIREQLRGKWKKYPHNEITVSLGLASFPEDGKSVNELVHNADTALYKAKAGGKNRTVIFYPED